jgi:hypothetical protein
MEVVEKLVAWAGGIGVLKLRKSKTWMAGTSPAMTAAGEGALAQYFASRAVFKLSTTSLFP